MPHQNSARATGRRPWRKACCSSFGAAPALPAGVEHDVGVVDLLPELPGALGAVGRERVPLLVQGPEARDQRRPLLFVGHEQPPALRLVPTALLVERVQRLRALGLGEPLGLLPRLLALAPACEVPRSQGGERRGLGLAQGVALSAERARLGTGLEQLVAAGEGDQFLLPRGPDPALGLLVEQRWHEAGKPPAAAEHPGEAAQVPDPASGIGEDQHAEHLPAGRSMEVDAACERPPPQRVLDLRGRAPGERVRSAGRPGAHEPPGEVGAGAALEPDARSGHERVERLVHERWHRRGGYTIAAESRSLRARPRGGAGGWASGGRRPPTPR